MKNLLTATQPILALQIPLFWVTVLVLPVFGAQAGVVFTNLYSFTGTNDGAGPGGFVQGSDGYFYGTTYGGGAYKDHYGVGQGTVFKMSADGTLTSLYSFGSVQDTQGVSVDGANPNGPLVQGSDGYFYGVTQFGGTHNFGTVFRISVAGALTSLSSFGSVEDARGSFLDGIYPVGGLVQGSDGCFYGMTETGGTNGEGTVFKVTANGALSRLYSFSGIPFGSNAQGNALDGAIPFSGPLVQGSDGYFYGTTRLGGPTYSGTVFRVNSAGALNVIYSCTNGSGIYPNGLVQSRDGDFYGTFYADLQRSDSCCWTVNGPGKVFKISASGVMTVLHDFGSTRDTNGMALDGINPNMLVQGPDGSFYGTTYSGGTNGFGTVFQISTNGALTTLYAFGAVTNADGQPLDGADPIWLVQGKDGNLYGTTDSGGSGGGGTFFRLVFPRFTGATRQPGGNILLTGTGPAKAGFRLWTGPDVSIPLASWTPLTSNSFDSTGNFSFTDASASTNTSRFYRLSIP